MADAEELKRDAQRKLALIAYTNAVLYVVIVALGFVALWAGIKHAGKAPVVSGGVLILLCVLPFAIWGLTEYLGHLKGRYYRQIFEQPGTKP